jgi:hypothetical protein
MSQTHHEIHITAMSFGGAFTWIGHQLWLHGPSWDVVPPLLFGAAAILGHVRGIVRDGAAARAAEQERTARRERIRSLRHAHPRDRATGS